MRVGWPPLLRLTTGGTFRPGGAPLYRALVRVVPEVGTVWSGRGMALKGRGRQLDCTRLARWDAGVDCTGVQDHHTGGGAVAAHAEERSGARRASVAALMRHEPLPQGRCVPEPWPRAPETEAEETSEAAEALDKAA